MRSVICSEALPAADLRMVLCTDPCLHRWCSGDLSGPQKGLAFDALLGQLSYWTPLVFAAVLQACNGLGPPASPGDIAVVNTANGSRDVDFYTPGGRYKFSTMPIDCATGDPLSSLVNELVYLSLQPVEGCAAPLPQLRIQRWLLG
jgi:hypothetical protein